MTTQALAEVLVEMLKDDNLNKDVRQKKPEILKTLTDRGLTTAEIAAVTSSVERWDASLLEVANVGAWKLITQDLQNIRDDTKTELNRLLGQLHAFSRSIPCTGS